MAISINCGATKINGEFGTTVKANTTFKISVKIVLFNMGDTTESFTVDLEVANQVIDTRNVSLFPSTGTDLRLIGQGPSLAPGNYDIAMTSTIGDEVCQTLHVEAPFDPTKLVVQDCSRSQSSISEGQSVEFTATIQNNNDVAASADMSWIGDGTVIATAVASVPANSPSTVTKTRSWNSVKNKIGTGTVEVTPELSSITETGSTARVSGLRSTDDVLEALKGEVAGFDKRTVVTASVGLGAGLAGAALR